MDSGMYQEFSATEFVDMFPQTNGDILVHTILVWIVPDDRHQSVPIEPCGDCGSFVPTETKAGMKVSNLYISQVKRKCGIEVGKNYNLPKNEDSRQPQCPEDKESAIVEALKHFKMNS